MKKREKEASKEAEIRVETGADSKESTEEKNTEVTMEVTTEDDFIIEEITKEENKEWYYIDKGEIKGTYTYDEMLAMYHSGKIKAATEVWNNGMKDWVEFEKTELMEKEQRAERKTRIPDKNAINDSLVWILAFVPLLLAYAVYMKSLPLVIILIIIHSIICMIDANLFINAGQIGKGTLLMAVFLTPVYLIRRRALLQRRMPYFFVWCTFFVLVIVSLGRAYYPAILPEPETASTSGVTDGKKDVEQDGKITIKKIIEAYISDAKYDLQEQDDKEKLLSVTGVLTYKGIKHNAMLQFKVKEDGAVYFDELSYDGETQSDAVYQELVDAIR